MSQIHEALKKAAKERVAKQDVTLETRLGDITAEIARRPDTPEQVRRPYQELCPPRMAAGSPE